MSESYLPEIQRLLPSSPDAEKATLASILLAPDPVLVECQEQGIGESHFHIPAHAIIYKVALEMWEAHKRVDFITITQELRDRSKLDEAGGAAYVTELFTLIPSAGNFRLYLEILKEKHTGRQIIAISTQAKERAYDDQDDVYGVLNEAATQLSQIIAPVSKSKRTFKQAIMDKLDRLQSDKPDEDIIQTGITKLDQHSPLRKGSMPLITGQRKAGKSILSLTIAENVLKAKFGVLYFSLEDPESEIVDRIFAGETRIPAIRHHQDRISTGELSKCARAIEILSELKMFIRDDVFDLAKIVAVSKRVKTECPELSLIVVDYAQLVRAETKKNANREQEVACVSRTLRLLSMEIKTALLLLSQVNEEGKSRESRALEQDATARWDIKHFEKQEDGKRLIHIPFQRNGDSNIFFPVAFLGQFARVENLSETECQEYDDSNK